MAGCGRKSTLPPHKVTIYWTASTSPVIGYYVYRASPPGGPYTKLNSVPVTATQYEDTTVHPGRTYSYRVIAVDSKNIASRAEGDILATVPSP
jgi:hypothetical protein